MKSEAVAALPKLRRGLGGADYEDCFLKDAGHDRVYCFRLAPKVRLPSDSENERQSLIFVYLRPYSKRFPSYFDIVSLCT